ncbi:hypothetical protein [Desmospora profundinema]|uniref:Uncharacterized protein n=1 Tax=Desmospora profundinema TaxID=1571184 RepID=A0ABU1ILJ7_9BACL|nr:hypothetical protein [Desmospora profundinema]MDR6225650.1 hypothetical protein [Desmospora profundinema]
MRTAVWTALICLLAFTATPIAFAETSPETVSLSLKGTYATQDDKHIIEVTLPQTEQLSGNWIVTLNGSDEQSSPDGTSQNQFVTQYDDLVEGRHYQVIAVFYGKNGEQPVDLNTCFEFKAQAPGSVGNPFALKECDFGGTNPDETDAVEVNATDADSTGSVEAEKGSENSESEESGTLDNMKSGSTAQEGGPMPETAIGIPAWMTWGGHLLLVGCALLGFQSPRNHRS